MPYYKSDEYGQIAINVGEVSSYLGIRTDTLGSSPNRQYWIRYASELVLLTILMVIWTLLGN